MTLPNGHSDKGYASVLNAIFNKVLLGICAYLLIVQFNDIKQTQRNTEQLLISGARLEQWVKNNEQRINSLEIWRDDQNNDH